ncbi:MAG TPA: hypothetical protein VK421_09830 [Pyrinomonadaceae bacterium]|nr:hypothetical protein [Pyrinomonadaceae bacterium]
MVEIDERHYTVPAPVGRVGNMALVVGAVALLAGVAIAAVSSGGTLAGFGEAFWRPYLVAYVLWAGVAVGSMAIMMLHHLSGGAWGVVLRRLFEAATRTLPLVAVLFLPIAVAAVTRTLYPWTMPEHMGAHAIAHKTGYYLNIPFFLARTVFYFAVWFALAYFLNKWSIRQDFEDDPRVRRRLRERMQSVSGPGIVLFGLTVTFAGVDWVMSLEPEWFSTIYGLLIMAGWGLTSLAFMILTAVWLRGHEPLAHVYQPRHFHDHGKLLLAFVMIWAYFSFSQYLIIWAGNLPEEIPWYLRRTQHGWGYVAVALVVLHFALPFVLLLSRDLKRTARLLSMVALLVLFMRVVDLFWTIAPSIKAAEHHGAAGAAHHGPAAVVGYALSFILPVGVGGIWVWYFARELRKRPLLPLGDEGLDAALEQTSGHH